MTLLEIHKSVADELKLVEKELHTAVDTLSPLLKEASLYFLQASGKRMRPTLTILAARMGQVNRSIVAKLAAALELLHLGSLVHDDVVDESELRRGQASVNTRYSNKVAVLLGDFFFARSLNLAAEVGVEAVDAIADIISNLVEGELDQLAQYLDTSVDVEDYWLRIRRKTALFLGQCCRLGAIYSLSNPVPPDDLFTFGLNLGLAYQVQDDLLDYGDAATTGKPTGADLQLGIITLPVIHLLESSPNREELVSLLKEANQENQTVIVKHLREAGSLDFARSKAIELVEQAKKSLTGFPACEAREALLTLADLVVERSF